MASKGKAIANSPGKRKRKDDDKSGGNKRKNRDVLQFFEDSAAEFDGGDSDESDGSFDIDDFLNDDFTKVKSEPGRFDEFPFFPKEEELSGDELEKMLAERYRTRSGYVRYAEDDYDSKRSVDKGFIIPSVMEPTIWKVKCKVGREKSTVFCLIQKFVDLKDLGTKLQIISAFAVEHIKGFVFVEAEKQSDVVQACNQLADVYFSLVTKIPSNEVGKLLVVKKRYNEVKEGTWARVKNGIYRGDLAQVVAVNNERKRATVKLIPRIDLQALTVKYGGGAISKRTKGSIPAARLISSRDLEEFRPLIQYRRDRDTGQMVEFLDSLMLKDGFLFKKVPFDSLSFWGVNPSEDELQKFIVPSNDESDNVEWLSQLYGEQKKFNVKMVKGGEKGGNSSGKGGGKGEGSSGSHEQSCFEVHDLVLFGKRDFGMVIGMEKDESYKILKDGSDGPMILSQEQKELKYVPQDKKFTALDHRMKTISINDTVRIIGGPSKDRQGIVKQIYRGVIFLYDENDLDNAYFCTKSQMSEKVKRADVACHGKDDGGPSSFEAIPTSPKSPLSPKKSWQMRENNSEGKDELFSVGQSLRIRIGPLKGYLCRVLAIRYSDITVKLDSKQKVLTVKRDHLAEVRGKSSASLFGGDQQTSSPFKPFDLLGTEGTTNDWLQPASGSADGDGWNAGGLTSERSAWPAFPSSGASLQVGTSDTSLHSSVDNGNTNDDWLSKAAFGDKKAVDDAVGGWGSAGWGKEKASVEDQGGSCSVGGSSWGQGKTDNAAISWGSQSAEKGLLDSWDKGKRIEEQGGWNDIGSGSSGWGKQKVCGNSAPWGGATESGMQSTGNAGGDAWAKPKSSSDPSEGSWGKAADGWGQKSNISESSGWGSSAVVASQSQAKESENKGSEDPWGKVADKWGNKDNSNKGNGWGNSANNTAGDGVKGWGSSSGGWTNSQKENAEAGAGNSWSKPGGFGNESISSFDKTDGNDSWGQSKNFENDGGFSRGRGPGGRGRGRDQFGRGRGRGRSFDRGQSSGFNKDGQDNYSSASKGWNVQHGSSWGNSSEEKSGQTSSWGKGKSSNDNEGDDSKGWNNTSEPNKDVGGWSSQKSTPQTGWNGASSGTSSWGQKSLDSGANDTQGNDTSCPDDSWGKHLNKPSNSNSGAFQGSWGGGQGNSIGWTKDTALTSGGWTKGGNASSEGRESWSKPEGTNSWGGQRNSDNDQENSWGGGSGGRRGGRGGFRGGRDQSGRGGFRGGRDNFGRGGGGRSGGRGQYSSWKDEGQSGGRSWGNSSNANNEGSSWSKGGYNTDGGGQDSSWKKPAEGGSSWGAGSKGGWSSGEGVEAPSWKKPIVGGSTWGGGADGNTVGGSSSFSKGGWSGGGVGGGEDKGCKKSSEGGGSWGGATDGTGGSGSGGEGKGWAKPSDGSSWGGGGSSDTKGWSGGGGAEEPVGGGGSTWGGGSNNKKSGWGESTDGQDNAVNEPPSGSWAAGQAGSSWGNAPSGRSSDAGGGWGK